MPNTRLAEILNQRPNDRLVVLFGPTYFAGIVGHLQALQLLQENNLEFDSVYGSHLGAITATAFAREIPYEKLLHFLFHDLSNYNVFDFRVREFLGQTFRFNPLNIEGICYGRNLEKIYKKLLELKAGVTNPGNLHLFTEHFNRDQLRLFHVPHDIDTLTALKAATAITAVFPPVKIHNEVYIDSGLFGPLPLGHIYENEKKKGRRRRPSVTLVVFQEAFTANAEKLSLLDRLIYSFNEKIRYHSTLIDLEEARRLPVRLILVSYDSGNFKHRNLVNLDKSEKWRFIERIDQDIARQIDYYHDNLSKRKRKCTPFPMEK